jgi:hypothetical protein
MGGNGSVPGLENGLLSENSLFWLLTNQRLSSANWHEEVLPTLPEAGLLREMASMMAVQLELSRRQNEYLENIATTLALQSLDTLEKDTGAALRNQYRKVAGDLGFSPN